MNKALPRHWTPACAGVTVVWFSVLASSEKTDDLPNPCFRHPSRKRKIPPLRHPPRKRGIQCAHALSTVNECGNVNKALPRHWTPACAGVTVVWFSVLASSEKTDDLPNPCFRHPSRKRKIPPLRHPPRKRGIQCAYALSTGNECSNPNKALPRHWTPACAGVTVVWFAVLSSSAQADITKYGGENKREKSWRKTVRVELTRE